MEYARLTRSPGQDSDELRVNKGPLGDEHSPRLLPPRARTVGRGKDDVDVGLRTRPATPSGLLHRRWKGRPLFLTATLAVALLGAACGGGGGTRTVTASDYRFENLPRSVQAGTTLKLRNESTTELHEMVLFRLPDDEKRAVEDLVRLPEDELLAVFSGEAAMVLLAPPNRGDQIAAVGTGKLTERGRYAVLCFVPTGADPGAFLEAAATSDGPPQVAGGPPHLAHGMFAEIIVK